MVVVEAKHFCKAITIELDGMSQEVFIQNWSGKITFIIIL